jgi:hypothetical protein
MDKPIEFFAQTAESLSNGKGGSIDPAFKFRRGLKYYFVNFAKENSHHLSLGVNLVPAWLRILWVWRLDSDLNQIKKFQNKLICWLKINP